MIDGPMERHSFVVRLWREQGLPWRGWVQYAVNHEQSYIQSAEELLTFIRDHAAGWPERRAGDKEE